MSPSIKNLPRQAAAFCMLLCVVLVGLFYYLYKNIQQEHVLFQSLIDMKSLGYELEMSSDFLTQEVRKFAVSGETKHFDAFWNEVFKTKSRDNAVSKLHGFEVNDKAKHNFVMAKLNSDLLIELEDEAMKAATSGDLKTAQNIVFGKEYTKQKEIIRGHMHEYRKELDTQVQEAYLNKKYTTQIMLILIGLLVVICAFFTSLSLYYYFINKKDDFAVMHESENEDQIVVS